MHRLRMICSVQFGLGVPSSSLSSSATDDLLAQPFSFGSLSHLSIFTVESDLLAHVQFVSVIHFFSIEYI
jgi:hypothetical protein